MMGKSKVKSSILGTPMPGGKEYTVSTSGTGESYTFTGGNPKPYKEASALITPTQINSFFNHLMGTLLTIAEASTTDAIQRKALKSIIGNEVHNRSVELQQWIIHTSEGDGQPFPYDW